MTVLIEPYPWIHHVVTHWCYLTDGTPFAHAWLIKIACCPNIVYLVIDNNVMYSGSVPSRVEQYLHYPRLARESVSVRPEVSSCPVCRASKVFVEYSIVVDCLTPDDDCPIIAKQVREDEIHNT